MPNFTAGTSFTDGVTNDVTALKLNALVADAVPTSSLSLNSTTGTIANFTASTANITLGTIPTLTAGTTTGTAGVFTSGTVATLNSTTGVIPTLTSTTLITTGTGTAASPAIVPTGDTNTGIFFPAADTIAFAEGGAEAMRIDSSGNVGIGTASPAGKLHVVANQNNCAYTSSGTTQHQLSTVLNGNNANLYYGVEGSSTGRTDVNATLDNASYFGSRSAHATQLISNNSARLTIDSSGNLLVGKTSPSTSTVGFQFALSDNKIACGAASGASAFFNRNTDDGTVIQIAKDGTEKGNISVSASAVAYNTSSDYRLKTNLEPISNGIERVKQLPVYRFNWLADEGGNKVDGFVAHEAQAIIPECVTGEKDAVDADGKPIHQGIDQSKIVPLLTAALKEAIAKIETLESKVTALEAA